MRRGYLLLAAASASLVGMPARAERAELRVPVVTQQTPVWCWAAAASMALKLLGFPDINPGRNYQCGVVAAAFPDCDADCTKCVTPIDAMTNMVGILDKYRDLAFQQKSLSPDALFSPNYASYPAWQRIKQSLDLSYPVIAGISPDGRPENPARSEHAVLITGYDDNYRGTGEQWVILKDPYPYDPGQSPYSSAGYPYQRATGTAQLPWRVLRDRMNLTSAVFLETMSA